MHVPGKKKEEEFHISRHGSSAKEVFFFFFLLFALFSLSACTHCAAAAAAAAAYLYETHVVRAPYLSSCLCCAQVSKLQLLPPPKLRARPMLLQQLRMPPPLSVSRDIHVRLFDVWCCWLREKSLFFGDCNVAGTFGISCAQLTFTKCCVFCCERSHSCSDVRESCQLLPRGKSVKGAERSPDQNLKLSIVESCIK